MFQLKDGSLQEQLRTNNASAYMLVYIRDSDRDEIMRELSVDEIPSHLKERFDEENSVN